MAGFSKVRLAIIGLSVLILVMISLQIYIIVYERDNGGASVHSFPSFPMINVISPQKDTSKHVSNNKVIRVASLVIYVGDTPPSWFSTFAYTAQFTAPIMDWYIFVTDLHKYDFPPNVKIIRISKEELYGRIARVLTKPNINDDDANHEHEIEADQHLRGVTSKKEFLNTALASFDTEEALQILLEEQSYMMVELKPCLGAIFEDYLEDYSHWAYIDVDTVVGQMHTIMTPEILRKYDIYTISFGDSYRHYMRGQFTVHRNDPYINNVWRSCSFLSDFPLRLFQFMASRHSRKGKGHWNFVSAEGCYSKAVAMHPNVSVFVAPTQISDAFAGEDSKKEWLQLGDTLMRCNLGGLNPFNLTTTTNALPTFTSKLAIHGNSLREINTNSLSMDSPPLGWHKLDISPKNCEYWVAKELQVCLTYVPAGVEIYSENGAYEYNEDYSKYLIGGRNLGGIAGAQCRVGVLAHFQGWKRQYFAFMTRPPSANTHAVLYSSSGFVPIRLLQPNTQPPSALVESSSSYSNHQAAPVHSRADYYDTSKLLSYGEQTGSIFPYGRVFHSDIELAAVSHEAMTPDDKDRTGSFVLPRLMGNSNTGGVVIEGDGLATSYCGGFSYDLKKCKCPILGAHITISRINPQSHPQRGDTDGSATGGGMPKKQEGTEQQEVGLVTAAWAADFYNGRLNSLLNSWILGPRVIVLATLSGDEAPYRGGDNHGHADKVGITGDGPLTVIEVDISSCVSHHTTSPKKKDIHSSNSSEYASYQGHTLPQNVLFNIGMDAVGTDLVCVSPPSASTVFQFDANYVPNSPKDAHKVLARRMINKHIGKKALVVPNRLQRVSTYEQRCAREQPQWLNSFSKDSSINREDDVGTATSEQIPDKESQDDDAPIIRNLFPSLIPKTKLDEARKELLHELSMLSAVIFDTRVTDHGLDFVRFPEELDGNQCYGNVFYRVLLDAGYDVSWSSPILYSEHIETHPKQWTDNMEEEECTCVHGGIQTVKQGDKTFKRTARSLFADSLHRYLHRVSRFRETKLQDIYSREPYGSMFDEEQARLSM